MAGLHIARTTISAALAVAAALAAQAARELTLGDYSREARSRIEGRIGAALKGPEMKGRVTGTVTFAGDEFFFVQSGDDGLKIVYDDYPLPKSGDEIEASGTASLEGGRVVFAADSWKKLGDGEVPPARTAGHRELTAPDGDGGVNWLRVEVEGRAIGITRSGFAVDVGGVPVSVIAGKLPDFLEDCALTHPKVRSEGVLELLLDQSALFGRGRYVMGVKLHVASADDVKLVPDVVYFARRRDRRARIVTAATIAALALGLLALAAGLVRQRRRLFRTRTLMGERKRMADDLHDTIEQHLVGAGMLLQLGRNKEANDILLRAKKEMRDIIWGLKNDDLMRLSPAEMIRHEAREGTRRGIYRIDTRLSGLPEHMDAQAMRDLSLIMREAVGNAVKHGGAKKIAVSSDAGPDGGWTLRIANDGAPFEAESAPGAAEGHFGIEGMKARARRLGATLSFYRDGNWTVLKLEKSK